MPAHGNARGLAGHSGAEELRNASRWHFTTCAGCAVRLRWTDRRPLCRNCRATERAAAIYHLAPGRPCPDCRGEVASW